MTIILGKNPAARSFFAAHQSWLILALFALGLAGILALMLALSRMPGAERWFPLGVDFFHKGLVTHVVFSFQLWLLAILAAMLSYRAWGDRAGWRSRLGLGLAIAGMILLLGVTFSGAGEASLNNYLPVLNHPLYLIGLVVFSTGITLCVSLGWPKFDDFLSLARWAASHSFLAALAAISITWVRLDGEFGDPFYNERLFWAGGHILQFTNTVILIWAWGWVSLFVLRLPVLPPLLTRAIFFALAGMSWLGALACLWLDPHGLAGRQAFTDLLWVGLAWPAAIYALGLAWLILYHRPRGVIALGLVLSLTVFVLGGGAGFALGVGDTRTPSHYHAVIGGINLALMALIYGVFLQKADPAARSSRWIWVQFAAYGGGQALHAIGFFLGGLAGLARKTAGSEQGVETTLQYVSMGLVGIGGAVAVLGGVIFVIHASYCSLKVTQ